MDEDNPSLSGAGGPPPCSGGAKARPGEPRGGRRRQGAISPSSGGAGPRQSPPASALGAGGGKPRRAGRRPSAGGGWRRGRSRGFRFPPGAAVGRGGGRAGPCDAGPAEGRPGIQWQPAGAEGAGAALARGAASRAGSAAAAPPPPRWLPLCSRRALAAAERLPGSGRPRAGRAAQRLSRTAEAAGGTAPGK